MGLDFVCRGIENDLYVLTPWDYDLFNPVFGPVLPLQSIIGTRNAVVVKEQSHIIDPVLAWKSLDNLRKL